MYNKQNYPHVQSLTRCKKKIKNIKYGYNIIHNLPHIIPNRPQVQIQFT